MSRLSDKLTQAAGVAQRTTTRIEARADALIAREFSIRQKEDEAFAPHEGLLAEAEKGLADVERALATLTNGGPPLEVSTGSSASPAVQQPEPQNNAPVTPASAPAVAPTATFQPAS